ncbi:hypothetical protein GOODEAATRI_011159, partial [Goodea atripinnis]
LVIYSRDDVELGEKNILICHVSGFFPAPVNVSWTKNGQKVTEGTSINVPFPNEDSTFTQISRLDFIPQLGDIYSCSVEHPALTEPQTRIWGKEPLFNNKQTWRSTSLDPDVHVSVFCLQMWSWTILSPVLDLQCSVESV